MAYATKADLENYIPAAAIAGIGDPQIDAALQDASDEADGYLRAQWTLPLIEWSNDLTKFVCYIAKYELMSFRGFKPDGTMDVVFADDAKKARDWLKLVAEQKVTPNFVDSSSAATTGKTSGTGPKVFSARSRGFGRPLYPGGGR